MDFGKLQVKSPQTEDFFGAAIFVKKCCRGQGREALVAVRRQRNTLRNTHAHGEEGEKSDRISRENEQDRSPL
jgi:hypothetical protein